MNEVGSTYRILAFDPAITAMGIAVMDYDTRTKIATIIHTETIEGAKLLKDYKHFKPVYSRSFVIQTAIYDYAKNHLVPHWKPDYCATEGAFHYKFVTALVSITLVINALRSALRDTVVKELHSVAPMETKKEIASKARADKDEMKAAVLSSPHIFFPPDFKNPEFLTEHEYDAIGHGVTFCIRQLPNLLPIQL